MTEAQSPSESTATPDVDKGPSGGTSNVRPFGPVVIFCCLLVTAAGVFMGYVAGKARWAGDWPIAGAMGGGGVLALLAAGLWCRLMYRRGIRLAGRWWRFTALGAGAGLLAGGCVAAILHTALRLLPGGSLGVYEVLGWLFPIGLGAATGLVVGLICTHTWYRALNPVTGGRPAR
jgi:hypothetical protein